MFILLAHMSFGNRGVLEGEIGSNLLRLMLNVMLSHISMLFNSTMV